MRKISKEIIVQEPLNNPNYLFSLLSFFIPKVGETFGENYSYKQEIKQFIKKELGLCREKISNYIETSFNNKKDIV